MPCKVVVLALWLLNQALSLALPALCYAADQGVPFSTAPELNKPASTGYDSGCQSCVAYDAEMRPYGGPGGGHHVPAKSAFEGAAGYDLEAALAIPRAKLERLGVRHSTVSGAQQTLYRAFAETGEPLTWDAMQGIETQALVRGGMNADVAAATAQRGVQALKDAGVPGPTRIPWGTK